MDENNLKWFEYTDLSNEVTHKLPFNFKYFQTPPPLPPPTCHEFDGVRNGVCLTLYTQPYQVKYCGTSGVGTTSRFTPLNIAKFSACPPGEAINLTPEKVGIVWLFRVSVGVIYGGFYGSEGARG